MEYTNRAMDVLEKENRLRKEIQAGSTLEPGGVSAALGEALRR